MKAVTLIAIITLILDTLASMYFSMQRFEFFRFSETVSDIMSTFFILSNIGLLIFFIRLFQKQAKQ